MVTAQNLFRRVMIQRRVSLAVLALVLSGCAGSGLGDRLGRSLEPDPQLAEQTENANGTDEVAEDSTPERPIVSIEPVVDASEPDSADEAATDAELDAEPDAMTAGDYTDIGKAPEEIRPYLSDLLALEVLKVRPPTARPAAEGTTPPPPPKAKRISAQSSHD